MRSLSFALLLWLAQTVSAQHLPQYYEITEINIPGSTSSYAIDINDQQLAVFAWNGFSATGRTALYDGNTGTFTTLDIGNLPGFTYTDPYAINNAGEVAGVAYDTTSTARAFIYGNGGFRNLGLLPGGQSSLARDLNDAGTAVGSAYQSSGETNAVQFSGGSVSRLTSPTPTTTDAVSVNNFGVSVGWANWLADGGLPHAVIFRNGSMTDLGQPGYFSYAVEINDSEHIAGYEIPYSGGSKRSFMISPWGSKQDLGALPGFPHTQAYAMNSYGMVVGGSHSSSAWSSPKERAFIYGDCRIEDLTNMIHPASALKPYVAVQEARAINNNGWILAQGRDSRDWYVWRVYILKPVGPPQNICT